MINWKKKFVTWIKRNFMSFCSKNNVSFHPFVHCYVSLHDLRIKAKKLSIEKHVISRLYVNINQMQTIIRRHYPRPFRRLRVGRYSTTICIIISTTTAAVVKSGNSTVSESYRPATIITDLWVTVVGPTQPRLLLSSTRPANMVSRLAGNILHDFHHVDLDAFYFQIELFLISAPFFVLLVLIFIPRFRFHSSLLLHLIVIILTSIK